MQIQNSLFKIKYYITNTNSSLSYEYDNGNLWDLRASLFSLEKDTRFSRKDLTQPQLRFKYLDKKISSFAEQLKNEITSFTTIISNYQRRESGLLYEDIKDLKTRFNSIAYTKGNYPITAHSTEMIDYLKEAINATAELWDSLVPILSKVNPNYKKSKNNFGKLIKSDENFLKDTDKYLSVYNKWNARKHNTEITVSPYSFDGIDLKLPEIQISQISKKSSYSVEDFVSSQLFDLSKTLVSQVGVKTS